MSLGSQTTGPVMNTVRGQQYIPEMWLSEVQMIRRARMLDDSVVKTWGAAVKKGDTFHVPRLSELAIEDKATDVPVAVQAPNDTDYVVQVDSDRTTAVAIDDLLEIQASYELRQPYLSAMGYALAKDVTGAILGLRAAVANTPAQVVIVSSTGLITGNGQPFSYAAFLTARRILLEADVPEDSIMLCISPGQEAAILTIPQFISVDFVTNRPVVSGMIGTLMGVRVIRTSLIGANSATGWRNGAQGAPEPTPGVTGSRYVPKQDAFTSLPLTFTGNARPVHTALMCQKEWATGVMSKSPKVTQSFENREQIWLMVGRQAYGFKLYRPNHAVIIHTTGDLV